MRQDQMSDPDIAKIINEIEKGEINSNDFYIGLDDKILYKLINIDDQDYYVIYLPEKHRESVMTEYHYSPLSGHFAYSNTYDKIRK